jgi:hypothetical protein
MASRRQVTFQLFQPTARSIFNPAPIKDTMTMSSATRSTSVGVLSGCAAQLAKGSTENKSAPIATQTIGSAKGSLFSRIGSQSTSRIMPPRPNRISR